MAIISNRSSTFGVLGINTRLASSTSNRIPLLVASSYIWMLTIDCMLDTQIEKMIANGRKVRCLWAYAPDSEPCSALNGILWELQRKVRQFHQSTETFWLHNGSIVNRNLVEFNNWKAPVPLP